MPPITTQTISFPNRVATAVLPSPDARTADIVEALKLHDYKAVLLLLGGADSVDDTLRPRLAQLFGRGIARATATVEAVIIDGGTKAGVMELMGQGVADRGFKSSLVGVAPLALVSYPGSKVSGEAPLDPNHSHFVLVDGNAWGSETGVIFQLLEALTKEKKPALGLLVGGGATTRNEALHAVRKNLSLLVVEGSGGVADEIAAAWKARQTLPDDPTMAEIIADGRIELHPLSNSVKAAERLIVRNLGGDNVLVQAWGYFAEYDRNAIVQQQRFQRLQKAIILIGVFATALALINEVWEGNNHRLGALALWNYFRGQGAGSVSQVGWSLLHYILLMLPITLTVLITASNRFKQGNKWLLLRAGAEAIKREIYRYRSRSGDYKENFDVPSSPPIVGPTPEQVLAQRVEDITRRAMRTEVNSSSLLPYDGKEGFPPYVSKTGDDGFSVLSPDRYVQVRLADQLKFYKKRAVEHETRLKRIQWAIFIIGGLGTLLAAVNQQVWIALTTAVAAALTTYLSYQQTESTLTKYNQAFTDLENVKLWWSALPADEQAKQESLDALVDHTEKVLQSELDGWVQQMQNALAELRKGQAQATEREDGGSGGEVGAASPVGASPADAAEETAAAPETTEAITQPDGATADETATETAADASVGGTDETAAASTTETESGVDSTEASEDTAATAEEGNGNTEEAEGNATELDSGEAESSAESDKADAG
ncbi:MAG TPA: DUF4231 domain-containing protein [Pyrinomonadaceae bacterium]|jgi:hypothetical protein